MISNPSELIFYFGVVKNNHNFCLSSKRLCLRPIHTVRQSSVIDTSDNLNCTPWKCLHGMIVTMTSSQNGLYGYQWQYSCKVCGSFLYRGTTRLYMHIRPKEGCGLGLHMLRCIKFTTIRARAANKHCRNLSYLRLFLFTLERFVAVIVVPCELVWNAHKCLLLHQKT